MEANKFQELRNRVFALYHQQRYGEALEVAEWARAQFPEREGVISFWIACLKCRLSRSEEALQTLEQALGQGHWWGEGFLLGDPDLEPIRDHPRFLRIVEKSKRRERVARAEVKPRLLILPPEGEQGELPLLIGLHGAGGTAEGAGYHWASARKLGFLVALPQSSQVITEDGYGWGDLGLARKELAAHWERLQREYSFDPGRVVLAGASQGGRLAIEVVLEGAPIPAKGFIAVVPAIRNPEELARQAPEAVKRGVQGWIITGEHDRFRPAVEAFCSQVQAVGLKCKLQVVPGLGHDFPNDFPESLTRVLFSFL